MTPQTHPAIVPQALLFGIGGLLVALLQAADLLNTRISYAVLTLLLLYFLWLQVTAIRRRHPERWLLNPAIICTCQTFVMGYGITNVLFFLPPETIAFLGLVPEVFPSMVAHQYLALLGALMLFLGYWSPWAARLTHPMAVTRFQHRYLPRTDRLRPRTVAVLLAVAVAARLFAMRQGLYGYGGDYSAERLAVTAGYSQYLSMAGSLGKLALLLAGLRYFAPGVGQPVVRWFWIALGTEIFFGLLSGMKSAVGMPIVIAGICQYLRQGVIPKQWILLTVFSISVAYAVIEPFRAVRNQRGGSLTSVSDTISALQEGARGDSTAVRQRDESESTLLTVAARSNLSYIGAFGLEYADTHKTLPIGSPDFLGDLFIAPLHALVPRFIWDSKPLGNLGLWYNQVIMGMSHFSSTAMGPFAYLYFAGGHLAVAVAFYLIGAVQRVLWFRLTPWQSFPGAIIMLDLLGIVGNVDSAVNSMIITLIRDGLLLWVLVHLIFLRRTRRLAAEPLLFHSRQV